MSLFLIWGFSNCVARAIEFLFERSEEKMCDEQSNASDFFAVLLQIFPLIHHTSYHFSLSLFSPLPPPSSSHKNSCAAASLRAALEVGDACADHLVHQQQAAGNFRAEEEGRERDNEKPNRKTKRKGFF